MTNLTRPWLGFMHRSSSLNWSTLEPLLLLLIAFEANLLWRFIEGTKTRTKHDCLRSLQFLSQCDHCYPLFLRQIEQNKNQDVTISPICQRVLSPLIMFPGTECSESRLSELIWTLSLNQRIFPGSHQTRLIDVATCYTQTRRSYLWSLDFGGHTGEFISNDGLWTKEWNFIEISVHGVKMRNLFCWW